MKNTTRNPFTTLALSTLSLIATAAFSLGGDLLKADREFLGGYEKVCAALAADDLPSAKKAASVLGGSAAAVTASGTLEEARKAFGNLSETAEKLAAGQPGYHVMHCPMVNKDWVQTSSAVANPYYGKAMLRCGEEKK